MSVNPYIIDRQRHSAATSAPADKSTLRAAPATTKTGQVAVSSFSNKGFQAIQRLLGK